jgi:ABC-type lipoprotein release transport system permease subunit
MTVVVRVTNGADVAAVGRSVAELSAVGPPVLVEKAQSAVDWLKDSIRTPRDRALFAGMLGGTVLVLMLVGVFAVAAFAAARRQHEIGVRLALGCRPAGAVARMLRDMAVPVLLGGTLGAYLSDVASRALASRIVGVEAGSAVALAGMVLVVTTISMCAAALPTWRACRVDPLVVLRQQ